MKPRPDLLAGGTRIGDKSGLESCVVSQVVADTLARLPLEGCEIHDMYMAISGESVCEGVHPCRVNMIYSNSRVRGYGLLGCLRGT